MTFPHYEDELKNWVDQHIEIVNEPIVLALYYNVREHPNDVYLLEILDNFGLGTVSDEGDFFETVFGSAMFPVADGGHLHLILSNPTEFMYAKDWNWPTYTEIRRAVLNNEFRVIYSSNANRIHEQFLGWLSQPEGVAA